MELRDREGAPLIGWTDPEGAFEAWKACTRERPCDYTGLSYARLDGSPGIQWPCNAQAPDGTPRLYTTGRFNTDGDYCETYGHDLVTGAIMTEAEYRVQDPQGRALLKAADYAPPAEQPDGEYPLWLTTGRVVYQWLTRTKTGRVRALNEAAPDATVEISREDARALRIADGEMVEVRSRRGRALAVATLSDIEPGVVFMPFHYGYWDRPGRPRAANELTLSRWDAVSKQPHLKYAAVRIGKVPKPGLGARLRLVLRRALERMRDALHIGGRRNARQGVHRGAAGG